MNFRATRCGREILNDALYRLGLIFNCRRKIRDTRAIHPTMWQVRYQIYQLIAPDQLFQPVTLFLTDTVEYGERLKPAFEYLLRAQSESPFLIRRIGDASDLS